MSDSDESGVTYTEVSSPFKDLSDIGSSRADDLEHLELPGMLEDPYVEVALQAPPSPDCIPGPEEPEQAPPLPDYVPGPEHSNDEIIAKDQAYTEDASPTTQSPEYVPESDLEAYLEEDDDEDPEEDPVDYHVDGGDDRDDEEGLGIALSPGYEVGESSSAAARPAGGLRADYGFVATMDREIRRDSKREVGYGITDSVRRDTDEIYSRLDDEQSERQLLAGRLNMLFRDRHAHAYLRHLLEIEARLSREAWVRSMDVSDLARGEAMSLRTTVLGQTTEIKELHAADHRKQIVTSEMLRADYRRFSEIKRLRTTDHTRQQQLIQTLTVMQSLQRQVTPLQGQQGPVGGPTQPELPEEAGSSSYIRSCYGWSFCISLLSIMGSIPASKALDCYVILQLNPRDALRSTIGNDSHHSGMGVRKTERATRECTYTDFPNNCAVVNQVKFATCTLHSVSLTWWNTHVKTVGHDAAYESDKIEKYIRGLPVMIHGSVVVSKLKTMQEAVAIATELIDHKIRTFAEREIASKRKYENTSRSTQNQQQQPNKRQNTGRVYTAASGEKKQYGDLNPYALNAIITKIVHVLQNDTNATKFAILPVTVGVRQIPTMLTIRGALDRARNLHVMSVKFKDILRE
nr:hypothetical protein [Tanacetum cinerariifolium]